jgi:hypothetical protein
LGLGYVRTSEFSDYPGFTKYTAGGGQDDSNESDSDEATTEVISHTKGLEALERALLCVEQYSKATPTDVMFMKRWRDIAASSRLSTFYQKKITDFVKKKGQFINV